MSRAIALYECAADDPAELSFPIGAILVDVEPAEDPDWFVGRIEGTNAVGLFPGNYVRFEAAKSRSATNTPRDPPALTFTSSSDDEQPQFPRPLTRLPDKPEPKLDAAALRNALKDKTDHLAAMAREKLSSSGATTSSTVAPPSQNRSRAVSEQTSSVPPALPPRLPPRPSAPPLDPPQKSSTFPPTTHTRKDAVDVIAARKPSAGGSEVHLSISALAAKFSEQSAPEAPKRPALLQSNREVDPPPTPRRSTSNTPSPIPSAATTIRKPTTSGPAPPPPAPRKPANLRSPALPQQRSVTSPPAIPSLTTKTDSDDDNDPPASVKPSDLKRMWETRSTPNQQPLFATKSRPPPPPPPASKKQQSSNLETPPPLPRRAVSDSAASSNNAKGNPPRVPPRPKPHGKKYP
ncbi:hypothetical protein BJ742DRAFT_791132 [Cladochytrium replicatum]|nr:hypothetical protein BJ742DRAFT_791132 [Cladochytrium replicatum]